MDSVKVGDRVMMHHYTGCNKCSMCRIGYTQMCLVQNTVYGSAADGGTPGTTFYAQPRLACRCRIRFLSEEGAAMACGTGTAFHAVKRLGISGVDTLAVFGQGPVGVSATMFGKGDGREGNRGRCHRGKAGAVGGTGRGRGDDASKDDASQSYGNSLTARGRTPRWTRQEYRT